jgi:hypothetical protein
LLAKAGSAINLAFESWVVSALFATIVFGRAILRSAASARRAYTATVLGLLPSIAYSLSLLFPGGASAARLLSLHVETHPLALGTARELAVRSAVANRMRDLRTPMFIDDDILALPWFSNNDEYPAVVLEHGFYDAATARGDLAGDGVLSLIDDRYFASVLVVTPPWYVKRRAIAAGYTPVEQRDWIADSRLEILIRSGTVPRTAPPERTRQTSRRRP